MNKASPVCVLGLVLAAAATTVALPDMRKPGTFLSQAPGPVAGGGGGPASQAIRPERGWPVSSEPYDGELIRELGGKVAAGDLKDITGLVVIKNGKLLIEEYYGGADRATLHNTRSVGKTFTSALMGAALRDGYIKSLDQTLAEFYDLRSFANYSAKKSAVTLRNLMTMSAAFLGSDNDAASPGNEENMYPTANWVKFALDLPMDAAKENGRQWDYFTAGVVLLGDVGDRACETWFCTGNGGNKIFVFTDLPLVVVVTATAYGKPYMHTQVDRMMERYVLPAVLR
jgi:CubicO group peptidase (beta-lactamase class C family)